MTDKEKIRTEIERLRDNIREYCMNESDKGELKACDKIISFIDSMPEEKLSNIERFGKNCKEESADNLNEIAATFIGEHRWNIQDYNGNIEKGYSYQDMIRTFKCGALWQTVQYEDQHSYLSVVEAGKAYKEWEKTQAKPVNSCLAFHRGEQWCKQQMMKDAVDGVVHCFGDDEIAAIHYNDPKGVPMSYFVSSKGLKAGNRVKVIIIKEDKH